MGPLLAIVFLIALPILLVDSRPDPLIQLPSDREIRLPFKTDDDAVGTRWAVLIAGSSDYWNYRHQIETESSLPIIMEFPGHLDGNNGILTPFLLDGDRLHSSRIGFEANVRLVAEGCIKEAYASRREDYTRAYLAPPFCTFFEVI